MSWREKMIFREDGFGKRLRRRCVKLFSSIPRAWLTGCKLCWDLMNYVSKQTGGSPIYWSRASTRPPKLEDERGMSVPLVEGCHEGTRQNALPDIKKYPQLDPWTIEQKIAKELVDRASRSSATIPKPKDIPKRSTEVRPYYGSLNASKATNSRQCIKSTFTRMLGTKSQLDLHL